MSHVVDQHRAVADPFGTGDSAAGVELMMDVTDGFVFPWRDGGVALLRRVLYPTVGRWTYCGLASDTAGQVKTRPGMTHAADQAYQYTAVTFLGNGMISARVEPIRVDFDNLGALISPALPMYPVNVVALPIAGGAFRIDFEYDAYGQGGWPTDFQAFEGATPATVDYNTPLVDSVTGLDTVPYRNGRHGFAFTAAAFTHATPHVFAVRGRNSGTVAELNTLTSVSQRARNVTPDAAPTPLRVRVIQ